MRKQLFILPFDHRSSFYKGILGIEEKPTVKDKQKVKDLKNIIYQAFLKSAKKFPKQKDEFGILCDEEHGVEIHKDAKKKGFVTILTTEKSGQKEYMFEYGNSFGKHIKKINPDYVKVLVRYNPKNKRTNSNQLKRLSKLSKWCEKNGYQLLFELLVPPTEKDLSRFSEFKYDKQIRPIYTVQAIKEIIKKVKVDIWKLEGFSVAGWRKVLRAKNKDSQVVFLGRNLSDDGVKKWLRAAAKFDDNIGFAVGRTIFNKPLQDYVAKKITKTQAIDKISRKFSQYINLWNRCK